jgi:hypothetical protein
MLGRYRRFDRADLLAWLEENKTGSSTSTWRARRSARRPSSPTSGCSGRSWARSSPRVVSPVNGRPRISGAFLYRGGRTRTCNPRFWRPVLCQLSYAPRGCANDSIGGPFVVWSPAGTALVRALASRCGSSAAKTGARRALSRPGPDARGRCDGCRGCRQARGAPCRDRLRRRRARPVARPACVSRPEELAVLGRIL